MKQTVLYPANKSSWIYKLKRDFIDNWRLYMLLLPAILVLILFQYAPMYGLQIAFRDFKPVKGITGSNWVGLKYILRFINSYQFPSVMGNTIRLSLYALIAGFPAPILFSLLLNQHRSQRYKKVLQTVTYMPHFISTVVLVGMINVFLSSTTGLYGHFMRAIGIDKPNVLLADTSMFASIYVLSGIWQNTGWDSIIYLAALSSINPELYEAATMDGASKFKRMLYIDIPSLAPTIVILLILRMGSVLGIGFEKIYLMQNSINLSVSEVISTYVYKIGLQSAQYSYSAAIGLFNTVINFTILILVNTIAKRFGKTSLF